MTCANIPRGARRVLSPRAVTVYGAVAAATFLASASSPTPLYRIYQEIFGLTPFVVTVIFAVYALSLLAALLVVGALSDHIGRRPVILAALILNAAAMLLFIEADSAATLAAARLIQGLATGIATTSLGATILDADRRRGPMLNSLMPFAGLTAGSLVSGTLVAFGPAPTQLIYLVLLGLTGGLALLLWFLPETAEGKPGALASLRPRLRVPPAARRTLLEITPVCIAAWSLGGFYFSLMPSLVRAATGQASPFVGGLVVAALTLTATLAVFLTRNRPAPAVLVLGSAALALGVGLILAAIQAGLVPLILAGTVVLGVGFGAGFSGSMRRLLPLAGPQERAGLLSAYYIQSYTAFSVPAVLAGLAAPRLGLIETATVFGLIVLVLALLSLVATLAARD